MDRDELLALPFLLLGLAAFPPIAGAPSPRWPHPAVSTEALDVKGASPSIRFPRKTCLLDLGQEQNQRPETGMIARKCCDRQGS